MSYPEEDIPSITDSFYKLNDSFRGKKLEFKCKNCKRRIVDGVADIIDGKIKTTYCLRCWRKD